MRKLSALLIVKNERKHLPDVIDTLNFADEIVVVDSHSDDGTFEFLQAEKRVKVIQRPFSNYSDQRNFCLDQAQHNWVLFVDADERVPAALAEEIQTLLQKEELANGYFIYRQFYYKRNKLRYSGLQTDKALRLFDRRAGRYFKERIVHESLDIAPPIGFLKNKLDHYFFDDYQTYRDKMISYGKMKGLELHHRGHKFFGLKMLAKTFYKFLNHFVIRLGFLDGQRGWTVAKLNALSVWERYKELKRLSLAPKE